MAVLQRILTHKMLFGLALVSLLVIAAALWPTLMSLHYRWAAMDEAYSHGYLIVLAVIYTIYNRWRHGDNDSNRAASPSLLALPLIFGASFVWFVGFAVQVQLLQQIVVPALIWLWIVAVIGWRGGYIFLAPMLSLYLVIPLWGFLVDPLRLLAVWVVQKGLDVLSITALIDGFRIYLPSGVMEVANGCSGLNYVLVSMVLGSYYSYMSFQSLRRRAAILVLAIVVAVIGNWARVFALVLIGHYTEMQSSLVYNHGTFGWLMYGGFLIVFFLIARRFEQVGPQPVVAATKSGETTTEMHSGPSVRAGIAATLLVIALPVWAQWQASQVQEFNQELLAPLSGHDAIVMDSGVGFWLADYSDYEHVSYRKAGIPGRNYELTILTYLNQSQGRELIYYKNRLAEESRLMKMPPLLLESGIKFNQSIVTTNKGKRIVWWSYWVGNNLTTSKVMAKVLQLPALLSGNSQASLVTISTPCRSMRCKDELAGLSAQQGHQSLLQDIGGSLRF